MPDLPLLLVLIDALRHDYIHAEDTPFLSGMVATGLTAPLRPSYGFQQHPAFLAGLYPERSPAGHTMYCFSPQASPFRGLVPEGDLIVDGRSDAQRDPSAGEQAVRAGVDRRVREVELRARHAASGLYGSSAQIPLCWLDRFSFAWQRQWYEPGAFAGTTTTATGLFDLLRAAGIPWLWLGHPGDDQHTAALLRAYSARMFPGAGVVYLHFGEVDWVAHAHGPRSVEVRDTLHRIDAVVAEIHDDLSRRGGGRPPNLVVFGDHGMEQVVRHVDAAGALERQLRGSAAAAAAEVIYFLDSTGVRCWATDAKSHTRVLEACREVLTSLPGGRLLANADLEQLHLRYSEADRRRFGELLWAADAGTLVLPNFFQAAAAVRGMHGYLPDVRDNWTRVIVAGPGLDGLRSRIPLRVYHPSSLAEPGDLVDVFPTVLDLLNLPVPASNQGRSLLMSGEWGARQGDAVRRRDLTSRVSVSLHRRAPAIESPTSRSPVPDPRLSVIIPTYNRAARLAATLEAFGQQSATGMFEVVVVDDGSTDATDELLDRWVEQEGSGAAALTRCNCVRLRQENAGPAAARNAGARAARGDILLFTGDDCEPHVCLVEEHLAAHLRGERVAVLGHVAWHPRLDVTPFMDVVMRGAQFCFPAIADPEHVPFTFFYASNVSVRRADFEAVGGFDESFRGAAAEDTELGYRLQRSGVRLVYRPRALTYHEHAVTLQEFLRRQRLAGREAVRIFRKHPELREQVGVADIANPQLREQFYSALLKYAFVRGVEDGLRGERMGNGTDRQALEALRGEVEGWLPEWAARVLEEITVQQRRVAELEAAVWQRDQYLASVVQAKDERINTLEGNLQRYHRLPPFRVYFWLKSRVRAMASF